MKCPMSIRVRCKDGVTLEITNIVHEHNHEVSKAAFNHLFHQRRLDSGQKNEIESVLTFKPNKRILQNYREGCDTKRHPQHGILEQGG